MARIPAAGRYGNQFMALSQIQIIQSLAEALNWFEKELDWGVAAGELNHLTGRIGELYAAMITRGQMASMTNQRGYDVVSLEGERISVKTVTTSVRASFNRSTLDLVDRIMILRLNVDDEEGLSVETLLDIGKPYFGDHLRYLANGDIDYPIRGKRVAISSLQGLNVREEGHFGEFVIREYENGSIGITENSVPVAVVKPVLRKIAAELGVDILNGSGKAKNTRQLGAGIIKALTSMSSE